MLRTRPLSVIDRFEFGIVKCCIAPPHTSSAEEDVNLSRINDASDLASDVTEPHVSISFSRRDKSVRRSNFETKFCAYSVDTEKSCEMYRSQQGRRASWSTRPARYRIKTRNCLDSSTNTIEGESHIVVAHDGQWFRVSLKQRVNA